MRVPPCRGRLYAPTSAAVPNACLTWNKTTSSGCRRDRSDYHTRDAEPCRRQVGAETACHDIEIVQLKAPSAERHRGRRSRHLTGESQPLARLLRPEAEACLEPWDKLASDDVQGPELLLIVTRRSPLPSAPDHTVAD